MGEDTRISMPAASRQTRRCSAVFILILVVLAVTNRAHSQWVEQEIKSFGLADKRAVNPHAGLIQGTDGALYGTTMYGGTSNVGTIFRVSTAGDGFAILHSFDGKCGSYPSTKLLQAADGALYGTTYSGGASNFGTVFKMGTDGTGFTVLHTFIFATNAIESGVGGYGPNGSLIQCTDGALYGTTYYGGTNFYGTVFRLSPDGNDYTVIHSFTGQGGDGARPNGGVIQATDGAIYGVTSDGGTSNLGTIFKLGTDGTGYTVLYRFTGSGQDAKPWGTLLQASDGALYGTTSAGYYSNTVFRISTDGSDYAVLCQLSTGSAPTGALLQGPDGMLYGLGAGSYLGSFPVIGGQNYPGILFKVNTNGSGYAKLYSFGQTGAGLLLAADGAFYGTTYLSGTYDFGTVFRTSASGTDFTNVYNFAGNGGDGINPGPGLTQAADGALYGTTTSGGSSNQGTIFRLNTDGTDYTLLYSFTGTNNSDGANPHGLIQGIDGVLYGTTTSGGANGAGTLFSLNTNGSGYTIRFSFSASAGKPYSRLVQGSDGMLYGTTPGPSPKFGSYLKGTVFKVSTNGTGYSVLHTFTGTNGDGASPCGALLLASDGALYGRTYDNGSSSLCTIFKLGTDGTGYTILYSSVDGGGWLYTSLEVQGVTGLVQCSDGAVYGSIFGTVFKLNTDSSDYSVLFTSAGDAAGPQAELVQGHDGQLYGTTYDGGANSNGSVFKLSTNGTDYAVLYNFPPPLGRFSSSGAAGGLTVGTDGALYGTTDGDGEFGYGTIYRLVWAPPPQLTDFSPQPDGSNRLTLCGTSNLLWRVLVATNLQPPVTWMPLTTLMPTNGSVQFIDPGATNSTCRFYQATWP